MKPETQQKILRAWERTFAELDLWLKRQGRSRAELIPIYASVVKENGLAARLLGGVAASVVPLSTQVDVKPEQSIEALHKVQSEEYAEWLLTQPEPTPRELEKVLDCIKSPLPNLAQHFKRSAKAGPRHRRGGRPKELDDPKLREQIRKEIKDRREPGINLKTIYRQLGHKYGVSPAAIKRIREEVNKEEAEEKQEI